MMRTRSRIQGEIFSAEVTQVLILCPLIGRARNDFGPARRARLRRDVTFPKINANERILAGLYQVCQFYSMTKRRSHRWFLVLGMVAMLGSLVTLPMTTSIAVAMAGPTTAATADQMPCHKPAKPCPDCPQKVCPNMASCLVKCFQPLSSPVAEVFSQGLVVNSRVLAAPSQVVSGSLTPPLLRPPSV